MAEVIQLTQRRSIRAAAQVPATAPATLYFDLASPCTYLVAERIERRVGDAIWRAAVLPDPLVRSEDLVADAQRRAHALRMPLVWPERFPSRVPTAMRVATYANEQGCGSAFAIAAGRLAFCGGFDLEDPDILAEGAAAAGVDVDGALAAARDPRRDHQIGMAGRSVGHAGGTLLPALEHERRIYCGEPHITAWLSQLGAVVARPSVS
ncbi:MAG TPA: DsbA family protein [Conexibacter sp.]|jgi:2-hydroxychromene-2-carboxylate isomerase|nr:DsbA family protein [Conexibacter sp.]